ncbi:MAG: allantoinase PuuE [Rhodoferax sp.]
MNATPNHASPARAASTPQGAHPDHATWPRCSGHYDSTAPYPRDLRGYGARPPHAAWPGQARVAIQFVLNYEEGGENCVLHGDAGSEQFLSELFNPASYPERHLSMEGIYEYGSRVGVWRILREFERRGLPLTVFGVGMALQRHPELCAAFQELGHEIACHGWRWIHYQAMDEATEREHMRLCVQAIEALTGQARSAPGATHGVGWYTGRDSPATRRLVADHGGFLYDSDYYGDDLPFWMQVRRSDGTVVPQLIVPYTLDCNDMRFALPQGYSHADPFFQYMKDTFDTLYAEGEERPAMMSIGMHCRLLGRPGRITALQRFLDHIGQFERVWVCRRVDIARHWHTHHPFAPPEATP